MHASKLVPGPLYLPRHAFNRTDCEDTIGLAAQVCRASLSPHSCLCPPLQQHGKHARATASPPAEIKALPRVHFHKGRGWRVF